MKNINKSLFLAIALFSSFMLISEVLYHNWANMGSLAKPAETFFIFALWSFILLKCKSKITIFFLSAIFVGGELTNRLHQALYKAWTNSYEYLLVSDNINEIYLTGKTLIVPFWPHLLWGVINCLSLIILLLLRKKSTKNIKIDIFTFALFVCLTISFAKSGSTKGINIDNRHSQLKAQLYSLTYFVAKVIPSTFFSVGSVPIQPEREFKLNTHSDTLVEHIFFVLGESQNSSHMSVFNYSKHDTTPFLRSAKKNSNYIIKETFAAGIATAVSLPTLFNAIEKPNGTLIVSSGSQNLYRLAKKQGYYTAFYSTQSKSDIPYINDIGARWIDNWENPVSLGFTQEQSISDTYLIDFLTSFLKENSHRRSFITLHQRGSHSPYGYLLDGSDKIFGEESIADKYDNTVYKTDQLLKLIIDKITNAGLKNWVVIYVSDHGQFIDGQSFGHIQFKDEIMSVPSMIYTPTNAITESYYPDLNICPKLSANQLPLLMLSFMGYDADYTNCDNIFINGPLLTGEGGYMKVTQDTQTGDYQFEHK